MKKQAFLSFILLMFIATIVILGCSKKSSSTPTVSKPALTTINLTDIKQTTAQSGGSISSDGGTEVTARGVCWNTSSSPTISNNKTTDGSGTGSFKSSLTGLTANTKYYVKAYATNSAGTAYGNEVSFTTESASATLATLTTTDTSAVTDSSVETGGSITSDGGAPITARGVCWSTSANPAITDNHSSDGTGTGSFISKITGLKASTTYYVRAYATNNTGSAYGNSISFKTDAHAVSKKVDTIIKATPTVLVLTTRSMDTVVLDWGDLFTFYIRLESYTGNDIKVAFHPKSTATVSEANPDDPIYDQYLTYKDTPDKSVLASYTLKDTMYTHWEFYNKQRDTLVYVILVHDKSFVGSPQLVYRLAYRTSMDPPATSEAVKTAVEKKGYGILNWAFF